MFAFQHRYFRKVKLILWVALVSGLLFSACSSGLRFKNLINYPVMLGSLADLDTLAVQPDVISFSGRIQNQFHRFTEDLVIEGRKADRPLWTAKDAGCLLVTRDATVRIMDFNFQGSPGDTAAIRIESGTLILEHCDFSGGMSWGIEVGPAGVLELHDVRFMDLEAGGVQISGGQVKIFDCQFNMAGRTGISSSQAQLVEVHRSDFSNIMGSAITLDSVEEVWLDSLVISDSFQDGIAVRNSNYILINDVLAKGNGRNGLSLTNTIITGLLGYQAVGNLLNGLAITNIDTLRIVNSEFAGNGIHGALISAASYTKIAGVRLLENGYAGLSVKSGSEFLLEQSNFQGNPTALTIDSVKILWMQHNRFAEQEQGVVINNFEALQFRENKLIASNIKALTLNHGQQAHVVQNLFKKNQMGLILDHILAVRADSNLIIANQNGSDLRSIADLRLTGNRWQGNGSASYFASIGSFYSKTDQWDHNQGHAVEILSAQAAVFENDRWIANQNGGLLDHVSTRIEACQFDSSTGFALKQLNGELLVRDASLTENNIAIILGGGTRSTLTQSRFRSNDLAVDVRSSAALTLSFCQIEQARSGLQIGNYGSAQLLANTFSKIDGYCVELTGPQLQVLLLRQNVMDKTGGIIKSLSRSGQIDIVNNTFAYCQGGLDLLPATLTTFDHNIFFKTTFSEIAILQQVAAARDNCFAPEDRAGHPDGIRSSNLYQDPGFAADYFLRPTSPCLQAPQDQLLIGARGLIPDLRPQLEP